MLLLWSSGPTPPCCCFPSPRFLSWLLLAANKISKAWNLIYHSCFLMKIALHLSTFWNAASHPHYHSAYLTLHPDQYNQLIRFTIWLIFCACPSNTTCCLNKVLTFRFFLCHLKNHRSWLSIPNAFFRTLLILSLHKIFQTLNKVNACC